MKTEMMEEKKDFPLAGIFTGKCLRTDCCKPVLLPAADRSYQPGYRNLCQFIRTDCYDDPAGICRRTFVSGSFE